jgi:predicted nucleic acid-binding protein
MIGIDTSFLVAAQDKRHKFHEPVQAAIQRHADEGFAIAAQVISEFVHVITDSKRFENPVSMPVALELAKKWWDAKDTLLVTTSRPALELFEAWMSEFNLGRKQVLDTLLAAIYKSAGVSVVASTNFRDFGRYPGIHPLVLG